MSLWARVVDESRCREVDGVGGRCQLVLGHPRQYLLQRNGQCYGWPVGAEVIRPPWSPGGVSPRRVEPARTRGNQPKPGPVVGALVGSQGLQIPLTGHGSGGVRFDAHLLPPKQPAEQS
jgi:hypothetical protein